MTVSPVKARRLAKRILRENRKRSYRVISREDFNEQIKPGTLNRFAKSKGEWIPKDKTLLIVLGLKKERKPRPKQKTVMQMNKSELLQYFTQRIEKMNLVLLRRGISARVTIGRDAA